MIKATINKVLVEDGFQVFNYAPYYPFQKFYMDLRIAGSFNNEKIFFTIWNMKKGTRVFKSKDFYYNEWGGDNKKYLKKVMDCLVKKMNSLAEDIYSVADFNFKLTDRKDV